ncbi:SDR family oxidoreductase [Psychroserpens burtonensis]|uniref:SDR family oxidoreductase n=1 Tax=Psychroserpens burtonensis TaxID=49278 RepID=A0A5C7BE75_9FLAO|nr:SDR family oxidoreductase [Psychroserpens burtonensis]TXE20348.1 SDR family oxidoreductase [Psychroserpens burtonensis]
MENVLVVGATGTTGKKIVKLLKTSQYFEPIAMVRNEHQQVEFLAHDVKTVIGDLEKDVLHTVKNIDKVVFAAGSGGKKVKAVDQDGAIKMIDASMTGKIKKFVMLSSMGADQPEKSEVLQDYLQAKHNADEHLKSSNLNYAIVRPGSLTNNAGQGKIKLAKSLNEQGEITRDDVAQTLVRALHDDAANKVTFEIIKGDALIGKAFETIS